MKKKPCNLNINKLDETMLEEKRSSEIDGGKKSLLQYQPSHVFVDSSSNFKSFMKYCLMVLKRFLLIFNNYLFVQSWWQIMQNVALVNYVNCLIMS